MKLLELKVGRTEQFRCIFQMQERQDLHAIPRGLQKEEVKKKSQVYGVSNCFDADVVFSGGKRWRTLAPMNSWQGCS